MAAFRILDDGTRADIRARAEERLAEADVPLRALVADAIVRQAELRVLARHFLHDYGAQQRPWLVAAVDQALADEHAAVNDALRLAQTITNQETHQ